MPRLGGYLRVKPAKHILHLSESAQVNQAALFKQFAYVKSASLNPEVNGNKQDLVPAKCLHARNCLMCGTQSWPLSRLQIHFSYRGQTLENATQLARIVNAGAASFCFVSANASSTFRYDMDRLE
jgi:hypothetical protein